MFESDFERFYSSTRGNSILGFEGEFPDGTKESLFEPGKDFSSVRLSIPLEFVSSDYVKKISETYGIRKNSYSTNAKDKSRSRHIECHHDVEVFVDDDYLTLSRLAFSPTHTDITVDQLVKFTESIAPIYYGMHRS